MFYSKAQSAAEGERQAGAPSRCSKVFTLITEL